MFDARKLDDFDRSVDSQLEEPYKAIEAKSRALANSLRRCFTEARSSGRFQAAYQAGLTGSLSGWSEAEILEKFNREFEEVDYLIFREFVRLLRACSLHIGGEISGKIKECYNRTFKDERILLAFKLGSAESKK